VPTFSSDGSIEDGALQGFFGHCMAASPDADLIKDFHYFDLWQVCDAIYNNRRQAIKFMPVETECGIGDYSGPDLAGFLSKFLSVIKLSPVRFM